MTKILCINYSQSGQLDDILFNFMKPLVGLEIDRVKIQPKDTFPFPWKTNNFYECMPETVLEEPMQLESYSLKYDAYDLIIFGYQPWFLSPSMPATALLKDKKFKKVLKDTPIVTVIGARNMWINAQISTVQLLKNAGAKLVANVAFVDRAPNQLSAISIVHWMMTGKKTRKWGVFPKPGVSDADILGAEKYGVLVQKALQQNDYTSLQEKVIDQGGLRIKTSILFIEERAKKIFNVWAKLIKKKESQGKNRSFWIRFFRFYLNFALFVVAPILLVVYTLFFRPLTQSSIRKRKRHFAYLGIEQNQG